MSDTLTFKKILIHYRLFLYLSQYHHLSATAQYVNNINHKALRRWERETSLRGVETSRKDYTELEFLKIYGG